MSVGSKGTDKAVTTTGEMAPVTIPTTKEDNNRAMIKGDSKETIPTGNNKDHLKIGGIIISRSKTGVITTSLRKEAKEITNPSKIKITPTSNEATGPRTGHHSGLHKTGAVSNKGRKEEMIRSNR